MIGNPFVAGPRGSGSASASLPITGDGSTITASTPLIDGTQTWNNVAVTFTGIKANITDTNSASGSMLIDLQVGGSTKFNVTKAGVMTVGSSTFALGLIQIRGSFSLGWVAGFGAGGTVTQLTSRTTAVTLNRNVGQITLFNAAGSATPATFTVNCNVVGSTDTVQLSWQSSGSNVYLAQVTSIVNNTSFNVTFWTTGGTASDSPVLNFTIIKGASS